MLLVHFGPSLLGCDIDLTLVMERTGGIGQGVGALLSGFGADSFGYFLSSLIGRYVEYLETVCVWVHRIL